MGFITLSLIQREMSRTNRAPRQPLGPFWFHIAGAFLSARVIELYAPNQTS
jgi:hypothetical protein